MFISIHLHFYTRIATVSTVSTVSNDIILSTKIKFFIFVIRTIFFTNIHDLRARLHESCKNPSLRSI
jgi:hypothetical protein